MSGVFDGRLFSTRQMRLVRQTFGRVGRVVTDIEQKLNAGNKNLTLQRMCNL